MIYELEDKAGDDGRHPTEKYDFTHETRGSGTESPETEMDNPNVRENTEETM